MQEEGDDDLNGDLATFTGRTEVPRASLPLAWFMTPMFNSLPLAWFMTPMFNSFHAILVFYLIFLLLGLLLLLELQENGLLVQPAFPVPLV